MKKEIPKYDFKEGLPQEFEIIDFDQLYTQWFDDIIKPHRAEFYQILWFQDGTSTHVVDFNPIRTKPNTFLFINKSSVQQFDKKAKVSGKSILFTDNFFCKTESDTKFLRSSILFNDLLSISQINASKLITVFTAIYHQMETELKNSKDDFQSDIIRTHLYNLLLHAERERRSQNFIELKKGAHLDHVLLLKDLLDENFVKHKKVSFYCEKMNITPKKLNQSTTKIFGKTPKEIIDDRVLLAAKRLLSHTNDSIKEVAFSLGFEEPTNFIKYFKKHTSKTPVEFRSAFTLS